MYVGDSLQGDRLSLIDTNVTRNQGPIGAALAHRGIPAQNAGQQVSRLAAEVCGSVAAQVEEVEQIEPCEIEFERARFADNAGSAAPVFTNMQTVVRVADTVFADNRAVVDCGGAWLSAFSVPILRDVAFVGNRGELGGALCVLEDRKLPSRTAYASKFTRVHFAGNSATLYGLPPQESVWLIHRLPYSIAGGALVWLSALSPPSPFESCEFIGNVAGKAGGAVVWSAQNFSDRAPFGCASSGAHTFFGNTAAWGHDVASEPRGLFATRLGKAFNGSTITSGAPFGTSPIHVQLLDGCGQRITDYGFPPMVVQPTSSFAGSQRNSARASLTLAPLHRCLCAHVWHRRPRRIRNARSHYGCWCVLAFGTAFLENCDLRTGGGQPVRSVNGAVNMTNLVLSGPPVRVAASCSPLHAGLAFRAVTSMISSSASTTSLYAASRYC